MAERRSIPWFFEEVGLPLLPLLVHVGVRWFQAGYMDLNMFTGREGVLWSAELPFFIVVLGGTTLLRAAAVTGALARACDRLELAGRGKKVTRLKMEATRYHGACYLLCVGLGLIVVFDLVFLGFYYARPRGEDASRPGWAGWWMGGQIVISLGIFALALAMRKLARKAAPHLEGA